MVFKKDAKLRIKSPRLEMGAKPAHAFKCAWLNFPHFFGLA
jgi:hypothetical protein